MYIKKSNKFEKNKNSADEELPNLYCLLTIVNLEDCGQKLMHAKRLFWAYRDGKYVSVDITRMGV
jgi:hypothetical protein